MLTPVSGPEDPILVRSLGLGLPPGHRLEPHAHDWHQLVYATEGVLTVGTEGGSWVVPPERAVWVPAGFEHAVQATGHVRMRTVYLRPDLIAGPGACCVVQVAPLLRELVLEVLRLGMLRQDVPEQARLAAVLVDRIRRIQASPLQVTHPTDPRACRVADRVRADLTRLTPLEDLAAGSGASARTIERLFREQTGLTFGRWSQRVRALHALERLAAGDTVTEVGFQVGYDSTSAFIAMFKRVLGVTPGNWSRGGDLS